MCVSKWNCMEKIEVCIAGDFNLECTRLRSSGYLKSLRCFMNDFNLNMIIEVLEINNGFTFHNEILNVFKMLDHCLITSKIKDNILKNRCY